MDRLARGIPLQWSRGALRRVIVRTIQRAGLSASATGPILFLSGKPQPRLDNRAIQRIVGQFGQFQHLLAAPTRLVLVPFPEKETILFDRLTPPASASSQLSEIVAALNAAGVMAVELRAPFRALVEGSGVLPYQTDDSHWSPRVSSSRHEPFLSAGECSAPPSLLAGPQRMVMKCERIQP